MQLINRTGHTLVFILDNGRELTIPPEGDKIRVKYRHEEKEVIEGVTVNKRVMEDHNLPVAVPGVYLIVSKVVKSFFPARLDLVLVGETTMTESGVKAYGVQL